MKLKWIVAFCVMVAAGVALGCLGDAGFAVRLRQIPSQELPGPMGASAPPFEITWAQGVLEAAEMYFPPEMEMLEVIHSEPTKQQAMALATRIGQLPPAGVLAPFPQWPQLPGNYSWGFGDFHMELFADGNLGLFWADRDLAGEHLANPSPGSAYALTVDKAVAIADQFLKETGLLPNGARMTDVTPKTMVTRYNEATGRDETTVVACSVNYRHFRDGFPEGGIGITLNGKGEVVKVNKNMRDVRSLGRYPILSPDEARGAIWSPTSQVTTGSNAPSCSPVRAEIDSVQMEYYQGSTAERIDTIQPFYIFIGTGWDGEGRPQKFGAMVPAIRPEYVEPVG